ncbi:hypothetical protein [Rhodanobacter sp. L36]|uniref:hypothetical protein n=1 Tax=Rhodanobacter sp. L36 TaxID=1747221 RepID=UPI00131E09D0|nr:hypothetical protein [Rhodanobacter sp. L36]
MTHASRTPLSRQVAAVFLAVVMAASALPAHAQRYRHGGYHRPPPPRYHDRNRGHGNGHGNLIAGALLGVIAGAAISNASQRPPPDVVYSNAPPPPPPGVVYYDDNNPPPDDGY